MAGPVLLERDRELAELAQAAREAAAGEGGLVLISGEAGIGKSSLVRAVRGLLPAEGRLLVGHRDDLGTARTLGPFRDLVGSVGTGLTRALREGGERDAARPPRRAGRSAPDGLGPMCQALVSEGRSRGRWLAGNVRKGPSMLNGDRVVLRPVRERDLATFIDAHTEISSRGEFFPLGVQPESVLRRNYAETGFWERDEGTLLIWNRDDVMVGHIEFFRPVNYWDAYELSYQLYGQEHAGQGYTTEAVRLLVDYLFAAKKVNRISLVIVPENTPSRRIAEKCGFQLEGTARGAFFNGGRSVDLLIYSLLRDDPRPWRKSD